MTSHAREYDLVLLGATGYTGKLTAEWISATLPTDLKWAIAGRNEKKLRSVVDELTKLTPDRLQPSVEIVHLQKDQLDTLATKTRLLISTVGPFMLYGEPVVAACAENGTHYLDSTGEVPWHLDMINKYHETAKRTGAIIVPQCGLDSVGADIMAFAVANYIRKELHAPTRSVVMTLYDFKAGLSGGTASTALTAFSHYPLKKIINSMKPFSMSPVPPSKLAKPPTSSLLYRSLGLLNIPELGGVQTIGPMASIDACQVHRSWGLYESLAKEKNKPELSYGPNFRFNEYMRSKGGIIPGALVKFGFGLFGLLMSFPLTRAILTPLIQRFVIPAPGEGPTREQMKKDFMSYRALGTADTEKMEKVMGMIDCGHGGYVVTALTLAAAAHVILRGDLGATEAGKAGGGLTTPATLGEQYVDRLNELGLKIQVKRLSEA